MRYIVAVLIIAVVGIIAGCSKKSTPAEPPSLPVVTADTTVRSPSVTDANDPVWNNVKPDTMNVSSTISPKVSVGHAASVSATVAIQAIVSNDSLFIRLRFADDSYSVWRDYYEVSSAGPPVSFTSYKDLEGEDQAFVMFNGGSTFGWDVWNWRVLTTDAEGFGGLAEGMRYVDGALVSDSGAAVLAHQNPTIFTSPQPTYVDSAGPGFHGAIMLIDSIMTPYPTSGWTNGQRVPGWFIDPAVKDSGSFHESQRASRFDIRAASVYDSTADMYTVVMASKLNTGFSDDLNLAALNSVTTKIGIFNDQVSFLTGGSNRGFTGDFTLKLK